MNFIKKRRFTAGMYLIFLNLVPIIDLIGTIFGYVAQYKKLKETKNSEAISVTKQIIHLLLLLSWIVYGIEFCTLSYITASIVSFLLCLFELILTLWYKEYFTYERLRILSKILGFKKEPGCLHSVPRSKVPDYIFSDDNQNQLRQTKRCKKNGQSVAVLTKRHRESFEKSK